MIKINNPVTYTRDEREKILLNFPVRGKDWDKSIFEDIKSRIREYLWLEQNKICPYCGLKIPRHQATSYTPIEHIVHKGDHPNFMFEPKNLVVSCQPCNTNKGKKETLINSNVTVYPTEGNNFLIIHPHFDNYFEHIELIEDIFLKAIDYKGKNTIEFCKLDRLEVAEERAEILNIDEQETYKKLVLKLATENDKNLKHQIISFIERT